MKSFRQFVRKFVRNEQGAAVVEMAFAFPAFIVLLWMIVQLGLVFRANSGIQHALGQGARYATLYPTPADTEIAARMTDAVYGIGPGTFTNAVTPNPGYRDLTVTYTQRTNLLLFTGPNITISKTKRVWVAD